GPADTKGGPIVLQTLWIDGKQNDEVIGHQGREDGPPGSFNGNGYRLVGKPLPQFGHPFVQGGGFLLQAQMLGFARAGWADPQIVFSIRPVQPDGRREVGRVHKCQLFLISRSSPRSLPDGSAYRSSSPQFTLAGERF